MWINVEDLQEEGLSFAGEVQIELPDVTADDGIRLITPLRCEVHASREGGGLRLVGNICGRLEIACGRCLKRLEMPLERAFRLLYQPIGQTGEFGDRELDEVDLEVDYYDSVGLDLRRSLIEQVQLAIPMKVLCRYECKGLCPQCGIDLNCKSCECTRPVDPRLEPLAALRERL